MGSLDLLSQANNHIQTQSNHLTDGFLGLTQPSQHKDALHSQIQVLGMDKNVLGTKIENGKWGKTTQVSKSFQETFNGFIEAKTTSTNTKFVDLSSRPLSITKNGFATKNGLVKWVKTPWEAKTISASVLG